MNDEIKGIIEAFDYPMPEVNSNDVDTAIKYGRYALAAHVQLAIMCNGCAPHHSLCNGCAVQSLYKLTRSLDSDIK